MIEVFDDVFAVEPYPMLYIKSLDLSVISDLHLGFELVSAEHGVFIPRVQFKRIKKNIEGGTKKCMAKRILLLGDVKHEFSETGYHEYREVSLMFDYLRKKFQEVILVKGNHDTFITRITRKFDIMVYEEYKEGRYTFIHGHRDIDLKSSGNVLIMGHEHPSVSLFTDIGAREKVKVFLYGKWRNKKIIVLPAMSYFAEGSDINVLPKEELLSPVLRKMDVENFKAIGLIEDYRYIELPEIWKLRKYG